MSDISLDPFEQATKTAVDTVTNTPSFQRSLDNFVYRLFRRPNQKAEMMRVEDTIALEQYKENLLSGYHSIPNEHQTQPKRCIVEPAFDESLYYLEEPELIKLFENVILSSADARYSKYNHPAFVSIIKQLSPLDASNLKLFKDKSSLPLVDYVYDYPNGRYHVFQPDVFLENPKEQDIELQAVSIRNLARLALLEIPEKDLAKVNNPSLYAKYKETPLYLEHLDKHASGQLPDKILRIGMICSYAALTPFGKSFIKVCVR